MNTKGLNKDKVYAKLLALSIIYSKEESCRQTFLKRISYSPREITAVMKSICDPDFHNWVEAAIPVMQCRENEIKMK